MKIYLHFRQSSERPKNAVFAASPGNTCCQAEEKIFPGQGTNADPPTSIGGEREGKIRMRKFFTETVYSRKPENGKDDVVNHIVCLRNHNDTLPEPG